MQIFTKIARLLNDWGAATLPLNAPGSAGAENNSQLHGGCRAARATPPENHRTQTQWEDALIVKAFFFQFLNSYTSLFYIGNHPTGPPPTALPRAAHPNPCNTWRAFCGWRPPRPGFFKQTASSNMFGRRDLVDSCSYGSCFTELMIQLAILFVGKQIFFQVLEVLTPWAKAYLRRHKTKSETDDLNRIYKNQVRTHAGRAQGAHRDVTRG